MSTERTPLTNYGPSRSTYIFPGVSPRSRHRQMQQFKCCMCTIFISALALGLVVAISYAIIMENSRANSTIASETESETLITPTIIPESLNATELLSLLMVLEHPLKDEPSSNWALHNLLLEEQNEADSFGLRALGDREILEEDIAVIPVNTPSFRHQKAIRTTPEARKLSKRGYVEYQATLYLAHKNNYTKKVGRHNVGRGPKVRLSDFKKKMECDFNAKYRTVDGTCNNKKNPQSSGCAMTPFRRALQPDYGDGISTPRKSHSGQDLPSARKVSLEIHRPSYATDSNFTVMLAVWGQFLDHDITATALTQGQDGEPIDCCALSKIIHPECFPVPILPGDPFFDDYNITCMNFVRSAAAPSGRYGPRQQLNQATAFIDGSVIYGNTHQKQNLLRSKKGGKLRMFVTPDYRTLLPISVDPNDGCNEKEMNDQGKYCFDSGDERANENLFLTSMHLLFARHHNYLAQNLAKVNPEWNDERLFQEARKILAAQMQHITYNEFLPILLGSELAAAKEIISNSSSKTDTYNPSVDPSVANNFAGAVFRFAHTLLPGLLRVKTDDNTLDNIQLHKMLFNPYSLWTKGGIDNAIKSATNTPTLKVNQFFTVELTEKLFEDTHTLILNSTEATTPNGICGLDLVSLNIQRGRDHGLPAYFEWRTHCGLPSVETWEAMANAVDEDSLNNMRKIYNDPRDVDLYTGALSEPILEGSIFGPVLACLITDQFMRIKIGDSFWYERRVGPQRFSKGQLDEIYKTTLAGIICLSADNVDVTQKYVMLRANNLSNAYVSCKRFKSFDFMQWSDKESTSSTPHVKTSFKEVLVAVIKNMSTGNSSRNVL